MRPARAAATASALAMLALFALIPLTASVASAAANPSNHGHHNGQLKHRPAPAPQPPPPVVPPVVRPPAHTPPGGTPANSGTTGSQALLPGLQIKLDLPVAGVPGGYGLVRSVPPRPQVGLDAWLMLMLVLAVMALWIYVFFRLARSARRWRASRPEA